MSKASEWVPYLLMIPCAYVAQVLLATYAWKHSLDYALRNDASFEVVTVAAVIFVGRLAYLGRRTSKTA
jgi:hypothetical protein